LTGRSGATRRAFLPTPTVESLVVGALMLFGFRSELQGISDNSSMVHLRTGIEMMRHWSIPRTDPYSFTAPGHPWVVQSWLASAAYGSAYELAGIHAVVFVHGVLTALVALVIATLARTGSAVRTMATASLAVLAGASFWAPRPLMFGLLALGLLILVVERRWSVWWLFPITWVWVNTHGSFPLGVAWLGARLVGEAIDQRRLPREVLRYLVGFLGALVVACLNPLGPRLLLFPFAVEGKRQVFQNVVEWRSPNFQTAQGLATLACLSLALLILLPTKGRWADTLPLVGFLALGLISVRNVSPAAVVLAPALGYALRVKPRVVEVPATPGVSPPDVAATSAPEEEDGLEPIEVPARARPLAINKAIAGLLVFVALLFTLGAQRSAGLDLSTYPAQAEEWMKAHGYFNPKDHRVAAQDVNGCYFILANGTTSKVFIDDRVDMYPVAVSNDYDSLLRGSVDSSAILDRYTADVVVWDRNLALVSNLQASGGWRQVYPANGATVGPGKDRRWIVLVRDRSVPAGQLLPS
jgi:hypothetical protein